MPDRRSWAVMATTLVTLISTALPWLAIGSADRTSYGLFRVAQVVGLDVLTPFRVAWFLVPVLAAMVVMLALLGHRRSAASLGALVAVAVGGLAIVLVATGQDLRSGVVLALVGAGTSLLADGWAWTGSKA